MERKIVITIGRNFGSNGRRIGERVAQEMGMDFYDRNLIELSSRESGMDFKKVGGADERLIGGIMNYGHGLDFIQENPNDAIYLAQANVIRALYEKEKSCVIVGRGADYVLAGRPDVLRVFVYAPLENRIDTVMNRYHFSREEAEKAVRHIDKQRRNYYEYFTDHNWDKKEEKELLINSAEFGIEESANMIRRAAEFKLSKEWEEL